MATSRMANVVQPQDKYVVRLPDGMRDRLKAAAADNKRSLNAEIVARLEASFGEPEPTTSEMLEELTRELLKRIRESDALAAKRAERANKK